MPPTLTGQEWYYTYLENRKLFNKTVAQLDAPQLKLVKAEENRILEEAMAKARSYIASAKAQADNQNEVKRQKEAARFEQERERLQELLREQMREQQKSREAQEVLRGSLQQTPSTQAVPARGVSVTNFLDMLPKVKDFAVASCRSPGKVTLTEDITRPYESIFFMQAADDREADRLSSGLGTCELRLFRKLIETIRLGNGHRISSQWVRDTARSYSTPTAANDEDRTTVSSPAERPREPGCVIIDGVRACPK